MTTQEMKPRVLGLAVNEETLRADLARYCAMALELGASGAAIIPASDVVIDERVRLKCVVPRCFRAGETPYCPPHALDLELVRRALSRFSWAILCPCQGIYNLYSGTVFKGKHFRPAQTILLLRGVCKGEPTAAMARESSMDTMGTPTDTTTERPSVPGRSQT